LRETTATAIEACEAVLESIRRRDGEIQRGIFEGDHIVAVAEVQILRSVVDSIGSQRTPHQQHVRERNGRQGAIELQPLRIELVVTVGAPEQQPTVAGAVVCAKVEFIRPQTMAAVVAVEGPRAAIQAGKPSIGAQPQPAGRVRYDSIDRVVGQAIRLRQVGQLHPAVDRPALDVVQATAARSDPDDARGIDIQ